MIKVFYKLTLSVFTEEIKKDLDKVLNDLPIGSHVYLSIDPVVTPFDEVDIEEQIRCCYDPSINEILIFEDPHMTEIDIKKKNSSESVENSEELLYDMILNDRLSDAIIPKPTFAWLTQWLEHNRNLREYYRFIVIPYL